MLFTGVISRLPGAGDRAKCTANLRVIGLGLTNHLEDTGSWPRQPKFTRQQQKEYEDWWIKTLKPYDVPEAAWQCPAILRLGKIQQQGRTPRLHYTITMFDDKPGTARKWPSMPWAVEIANAHGHGSLLVLQDGSVHDWDLYVAKYQKRER